MLRTRAKVWIVFSCVLALYLLACTIEEDLHIDADGSGTYRVKISIPKELGQGFDDFRKTAEKDGFRVVEAGETEKTRFIVVRKDFDDVRSLNDSHHYFELTTTKTGFLRREYRLSVQLKAVAFGSFQRRMVVAMPGRVTSSTAGEIDGSRVTWQGTGGGAFEVVASGLYVPLSRNQKLVIALVLAAAAILFVLRRRPGARPGAAVCPTCNNPIPTNARFCAGCGAGTPLPQRP